MKDTRPRVTYRNLSGEMFRIIFDHGEIVKGTITYASNGFIGTIQAQNVEEIEMSACFAARCCEWERK